jgi:hypothetical protein
MKTLKLEEFLKLPVGTIFYNFDLDNICVKEDSIIEDDYLDFYYMEISNVTNDLKRRYGSPELDEEFDVLEKEDLLVLKDKIDNALKLPKIIKNSLIP